MARKKTNSSRSRKKKNRRRRKSNGTKRRLSGLPLVIDNAPFRDAARQEYQEIRSRLESLEASLRRFEDQDQPAFRRWMNLSFSNQLEELRELSQSIAKKEQFLDRYYYLKDSKRIRAVQAYAQVKREQSEGVAWNPDQLGQNGDGDGSRFSVKGSDQDPFSDPDPYESESFRFFYEMLRSEWERSFGTPPPDYETVAQDLGWRDPSMREAKGKVKALYREIARLLHPDHGQVLCDQRRELWLKAQEAYEYGDLFELEAIFAQIHIESEDSKEVVDTAWYRNMVEKAQARIDYLEFNIGDLCHDPAWNFTKKTKAELKRMSSGIQRELAAGRKEAKEEEQALEREMQRLEARYQRHLARSRQRTLDKPRAHASAQLSLSFGA